MSRRLLEMFDFRGRLSRLDHMRLERRLILLAIPGVAAPILLLMAGIAPLVAALPALVLPLLVVAGAAGSVRRLHDVGRHAHRVYAKRLGFAACLIGTSAAGIFIPGLPEEVILALTGAVVVAVLVSFFVRDLAWTELRRGDPGSNRFGPPPSE